MKTNRFCFSIFIVGVHCSVSLFGQDVGTKVSDQAIFLKNQNNQKFYYWHSDDNKNFTLDSLPAFGGESFKTREPMRLKLKTNNIEVFKWAYPSKYYFIVWDGKKKYWKFQERKRT